MAAFERARNDKPVLRVLIDFEEKSFNQ